MSKYSDQQSSPDQALGGNGNYQVGAAYQQQYRGQQLRSGIPTSEPSMVMRGGSNGQTRGGGPYGGPNNETQD